MRSERGVGVGVASQLAVGSNIVNRYLQTDKVQKYSRAMAATVAAT